ncbi:MAG: hypothetical protein GXX91_04385 [Verrucomicrobiaceae bacterium]|nr:hypothetical protein [Verrucomicrobiaceae bacterium]
MNPEYPVSPPVREVHHYHPRGPEPGLAVVLELLPGLFLQTFGIGNIYAGNVAGGVLMMLGYWATCLVNFLLCAIFIGFITWPLTWIGFMIFCPILANGAAKRR